jgi:hypothetical protein
MADCNDSIQKFLSQITISTEQRKNLQRGRNAIKERIENYFSGEPDVKIPEFYLQGSYALKTMVVPLNPADEYDLDDGVYLQHTDDDMSNPTPQEASEWIIEAVKNHTKKKPRNLKNCVRVVYANGYHIDLPVYREIKGQPHLGTLEGNKWIPSDARAFNDWFHERLEKTEQMRSCIKYLKAWKDFKGCDLKGIHITVLVGLNHIAVKDRDDESLTKTLEAIINYLKDNKSIANPVEDENLIEDWDSPKIDKAIKALEGFYEKATHAIDTDDVEEAVKTWRKAFGDRFPKDDATNQARVAAVAAAPAHREFTSRTKPWGEIESL